MILSLKLPVVDADIFNDVWVLPLNGTFLRSNRKNTITSQEVHTRTIILESCDETTGIGCSTSFIQQPIPTSRPRSRQPKTIPSNFWIDNFEISVTIIAALVVLIFEAGFFLGSYYEGRYPKKRYYRDPYSVSTTRTESTTVSTTASTNSSIYESTHLTSSGTNDSLTIVAPSETV